MTGRRELRARAAEVTAGPVRRRRHGRNRIDNLSDWRYDVCPKSPR